MDYPSHKGPVPLDQIARPHLDNALKKLRAQETALSEIVAGLEPAPPWFASCPWAPLFTPEEILERTRTWIEILAAEQARREAGLWPLQPDKN